jgi:hypothetical protein
MTCSHSDAQLSEEFLMGEKLSGPMTVRITEGEIIESQLSTDDMSDVDVELQGKCEGGWCAHKYSSAGPEQ